jgi:hypothetical protein
MESVFTLLPELEVRGNKSIATPVAWTGDLSTGEALFDLNDGSLKVSTRPNGSTLLRGMSTELVPASSAIEVGIGLGIAEFHHIAFDADLTAERFDEPKD